MEFLFFAAVSKMHIAGLGVLMFTIVVLALVAVVLGAKSKLVNSEDVTIIISLDSSCGLDFRAVNKAE